MSGGAGSGDGGRVPRRLFISAFFMDAGFFLMTAAVPFKVLALGGGPATLGLVAAVAAGSYVLLARVGGLWSDSPRRAGLALAGSLVLIVFALGAARTGRLGVLVALMPLMSLGKAFYWPVVETALADLSGPRGLERQVGTFNLAWSSGKTAGFAAGGLLLAGAGFGPAFLCGSLLAAIAFASLPWRGLGAASPRGDPGAPAGPPAPGRPEAEARRFRLAAWIANLAAYGAAGVLIHHLPKWFAELGWSPSRFGAVQALIYLSQTAVFLLLVRRVRIAYRPARFLVPLGLATAILAVLPWLRGFAALLSIAPVIGLAFGTAYAASMYHSLDAPSGRGRNAGIHESLIGLGGLLPPLLGGLAARWSGWLGAPYLLAAGFLAAALVAAWALVAPGRLRSRRAADAMPEAR